MDTIDFVIPWVDGSDSRWQSEKRKYEAIENKGIIEQVNANDISRKEDANEECRFREFGFLRYWFRAVECCAPWVNRIHFVTCGQKPDWLNEMHPKLNLVNHRDYIPEEYLPTFNSNTIELNYHRIKDLAEHFVVFNDDMFLIQPIAPSFFFRDGNPVLATTLRYPRVPHANTINRIKFNNYVLINNHFNTRKSIWSNRRKWFSISDLGIKRVRINLTCFLANKTIPVGMFGHVGLPHLKSAFEEVWASEFETMDETSRCRFRSDTQVNHWMLCAWNQAKGRFSPTLESRVGQHLDISPDNIGYLIDCIRNRSFPQLCINDTRFNTEPEKDSLFIMEALDSIYPDKSGFEK